MTFETLPECGRDLKRLCKKCRSLGEDILVIRKILAIRPGERPPLSDVIGQPDPRRRTIRLSKIACKNVKGSGACSGLNLVYAWFESEQRIVFPGLYHNVENGAERKIRRRKFS